MRLPKVAVSKGVAQIHQCSTCGGNSSTGCLGPSEGSPVDSCGVYLASGNPQM